MISWIKGELISSWHTNNKYYVLINCQGLGYEIQVLNDVFSQINDNNIEGESIILWLKHIKKEDSDMLFGFKNKEQKDFFVEILNIKGIGSQIGMSLLSKFALKDIIKAINDNDKNLICSVQGIGQKMTDRLILELKSKLNNPKFLIKGALENKDSNFLKEKDEINSIVKDIELTLISLNYSNKEIKNCLPIIFEKIQEEKTISISKEIVSFENLLKMAMNYLDKHNTNLGQ